MMNRAVMSTAVLLVALGVCAAGQAIRKGRTPGGIPSANQLTHQ
jgi:hypothetical protein